MITKKIKKLIKIKMQCMPYELYIHNKLKVELMRQMGYEFIYKKSMIKIVFGSITLGLGILGLPIPMTGSIILIPVGISLLLAGGIDIYAMRKSLKWHIKTKIKMRKNK